MCTLVFLDAKYVYLYFKICFYCKKVYVELSFFKGALSGLRQFLATENPLKMIKNAFYFTSKVPFVLNIFKFLS